MIELSIKQILEVWDHLTAAYYKKHGFGSGTAEIYMYLTLPFSHNVGKEYKTARYSMIEVFKLFQKEWNCTLEILEYKTFNKFLTSDEKYRIHVKVIRPKLLEDN